MNLIEMFKLRVLVSSDASEFASSITSSSAAAVQEEKSSKKATINTNNHIDDNQEQTKTKPLDYYYFDWNHQHHHHRCFLKKFVHFIHSILCHFTSSILFLLLSSNLNNVLQRISRRRIKRIKKNKNNNNNNSKSSSPKTASTTTTKIYSDSSSYFFSLLFIIFITLSSINIRTTQAIGISNNLQQQEQQQTDSQVVFLEYNENSLSDNTHNFYSPSDFKEFLGLDSQNDDNDQNMISLTGDSGGGGSGNLTSIGQAAAANSDDKFEQRNQFAVKYIWSKLPIGFLVLGTIANILSIIVFTRREMRKFSSFCYFAVLNAVNLAFLYVTLIRVIMDFNFQTDIRLFNLFTCKSHVFLTYFLGHLSSLLLCSISIDRVISVVFLHRAKSLCTPRVAFTVTIILIVFNFLISSHFLIFDSAYIETTYISSVSGIADQLRNSLAAASAAADSLSKKSDVESKLVSIQLLSSSSTKSNQDLSAFSNVINMNYKRELIQTKVVCETRNNTVYHYFIRNTWKLVDMSLYAFLPFAIMFTCSVIIIVRVAQQSKKFSGGIIKNKSSRLSSNHGGGGSGSLSSRKTTELLSSKKSKELNKKLLKKKLNQANKELLVGKNNNCNRNINNNNNNNNKENKFRNGDASELTELNTFSINNDTEMVPSTRSSMLNLSVKNNNSNSLMSPLTSNRPSQVNSVMPPLSPTARNSSEAKFSTRTRNLALMLIPVNILFLLFLSPVVICMYTYENLGRDQLALAIVEHLSYCNFTFNFFIYFLTSSKFREEFFKFVDETYEKFFKSPQPVNYYRHNTHHHHNNHHNHHRHHQEPQSRCCNILGRLCPIFSKKPPITTQAPDRPLNNEMTAATECLKTNLLNSDQVLINQLPPIQPQQQQQQLNPVTSNTMEPLLSVNKVSIENDDADQLLLQSDSRHLSTNSN